MNEPIDLDEIARRWSAYAWIGHNRSDKEFDDAACRVLARHAFDDVPALIAENKRLRAQLDGGEAAS